jgi:hypothetical protein
LQVAFNFVESEAYAEIGNWPSLDLLTTAAIGDTVPAHRRHCRIQVGSVPTYDVPAPDRPNLSRSIVQYPARWRGTSKSATFQEAFVTGDLCAVVVDGLTPMDARSMDETWEAELNRGYVGAFQLLRGDELHEALYFMSLPTCYGIYGTALDFLVAPGVESGFADYDEVKFDELAQTLPRHGITTVRLRSYGAVGTIFDPYETNIDYARQVGRVERLLGGYVEGIISEINLRARESDPRLIMVLEAALEALESDRGPEFVSQASLSCRRFLERLANLIYPARTTAEGERKLGPEQFRNRLLAYVDSFLGPNRSAGAKKDFTSRLEMIVDVANKGLHGEVAVDEVHRLVLNLALLTHDLLKLTPPAGLPSASYGMEQMAEIQRFVTDASPRDTREGNA